MKQSNKINHALQPPVNKVLVQEEQVFLKAGTFQKHDSTTTEQPYYGVPIKLI